jgi:phosphohistidine phosphatase
MLELLLLRHAKSRWDQPGVRDLDRDLAPRGEKAAPRIGRLMAAEGLLPDLVLCSPARRAMHTWQLVAAQLQASPEVRHDDGLYLAPPGRLIELLRREGGRRPRLLILGHNPGLQALAVKLVGEGKPALRAALAEKFPTAALARIGFEIAAWAELAPRSGRLLGYWRPRDLAG